MGCALSSVFACLWCASGCSAQKVGAHFAFFPPEPPTYTLSMDEEGQAKLRLHLRLGARQERPEVSTAVKLITTTQGQHIPVFSFRVPQPSCTVLFSHGNATDCGIIFYYLLEMAYQLNADIFAYDYTGYGASSGTPSERAAYADITAVYEHIAGRGVNPAEELILYGQSVGTGPSCYLAAHRPVRGLVLHSPMATGIRVISNSDSLCAPASMLSACDLFPNIRRIPNIESKVFIIHGTHDQVIDIDHSKRLLAKWPEASTHPPYFVDGAGHDDVYEMNPEEFYLQVRQFISATAMRK